MKAVEIKDSGYRKIERGEVWLYARDVKKIPASVIPGDTVEVLYGNRRVGCAFANPLSRIVLRMLEGECAGITEEWLIRKLKESMERRSDLMGITNSIRLVHAEADGLPGLIVDMYGKNIVCSFSSAGMERMKREVVDALVDLVKPSGIYEKSDPTRLKEGLPVIDTDLYGEIDDEFVVEENGFKFLSFLKRGQKTGFFLDQRKNREVVGRYGNKRTLDLFSGSGGFGIYASAEFTRFVESSALACEQIEWNCRENGLDRYEIVKEDVFRFLEAHDELYDLIIIDPPAFAKSRDAKRNAIKGFKYLLSRAVNLLLSGGYLAVFSCSSAIGFDDLLDVAGRVGIMGKAGIEIVDFLKQDVDHPYIVNIPSSLYLTGLLIRKR